MSNTLPAEKIMSEKQAAYFIGKRIDLNKWAVPEGYGVCVITGKFQKWDDLMVTFAHHHFTKDQRALLGAWGVGWCEDADLLSEEGYECIMARVEACGLREIYEEGHWH